MKIAQVSPLFESVPPKTYGGTERIVSYLTEELVRRGHEVTLFASGDSVSSARLVPVCARALRLEGNISDSLAYHTLELASVFRLREDFDIIHFHIDYLHFPTSRYCQVRHVTTLHGRLDLPELAPLYGEFSDMPLISISDAQRRPLPHARWMATVQHGLSPDLYDLCESPGDYLAFLGRVSPEKGLPAAIEIATRLEMPLKIAAKVDPVDREYFADVIAPMIDRPNIEFVGEIGEDAKGAFLGNARALLAPVDWPEPFGLVLIEAMACGTPVIARRRGSIPEIVEHGRSGFIVENVDEAVDAVLQVAGISRRDCRHAFESRFTAGRMAEDYERVYEQLLEADEHTSISALAAG
jgi:glycosyltransferase involved in cell wall biosynthesis